MFGRFVTSSSLRLKHAATNAFRQQRQSRKMGGPGGSSNPFEQDAHDKFMANLGEAIGFFMWLWIFHRARQDGPVVLGWRHPWEHAHDPWAIHETPAELYEFEQKTPKALYDPFNEGSDDDEEDDDAEEEEEEEEEEE